MKNSVYRKLLTAFLVVTLFSSGIYLYVSANEDQNNFNKFTLAHSQTGNIQTNINTAIGPLRQMGSIRDGTVTELGKHKQQDRKNVREIIVSAITLSVGGVVNNLFDQFGVTTPGMDLVTVLDKINDAIDYYIDTEIAPIFNTPDSGYNDTFNRLLEYYGKLNDDHRQQANEAIFGKSTTDDLSGKFVKMDFPDKNRITVSPCANPSGKCFGYYQDANEHLVNCSQKHGKSGETDIEYWQCENNQTCTRESEHWIECRALCGDYFPPPTKNITMAANTFEYFIWESYHDHGTICQEPIYSIWNGIFGYQAKCGRKYYTCEGGCPHREDEGVFYNKTVFKVYETLAVKVIREDLYMATMDIDGETVTAYASGDELTLSKTFDSGDIGNHTVTITVWYGDVNAPESTPHTSNISVE